MSALQINGNDLSLNDLREVVYEQRPVELAESARKNVIAAREVVEKLLRENRVAYAINTGVGKLKKENWALCKEGPFLFWVSS